MGQGGHSPGCLHRPNHITQSPSTLSELGTTKPWPPGDVLFLKLRASLMGSTDENCSFSYTVCPSLWVSDASAPSKRHGPNRSPALSVNKGHCGLGAISHCSRPNRALRGDEGERRAGHQLQVAEVLGHWVHVAEVLGHWVHVAEVLGHWVQVAEVLGH